jgi:predicted deacylase
MVTRDPVTIPVKVIRAKKSGPVLFVCSAIHGDELVGVEIIRRLLRHPGLRLLRGSLLAVPTVNVHGMVIRSRYLPDRRDLNRHFPGRKEGTLASTLAYTFLKEIVRPSTHGIDIHTASAHRFNLPQIRGALTDPETGRLARAFGVPVLFDAPQREGSLRASVVSQGKAMLLYEAGEALRYDEQCIEHGVSGVLRVMQALDMIAEAPPLPDIKPFIARSSRWVRAPRSGIFRPVVAPGEIVKRNQTLGIVSDALGEEEFPVVSSGVGIVIGSAQLPLVYRGDALFHIGQKRKPVGDGQADGSLEDDSFQGGLF